MSDWIFCKMTRAKKIVSSKQKSDMVLLCITSSRRQSGSLSLVWCGWVWFGVDEFGWVWMSLVWYGWVWFGAGELGLVQCCVNFPFLATTTTTTHIPTKLPVTTTTSTHGCLSLSTTAYFLKDYQNHKNFSQKIRFCRDICLKLVLFLT